jgi:ABC-type glycerol-3-phosphate transport system permease component
MADNLAHPRGVARLSRSKTRQVFEPVELAGIYALVILCSVAFLIPFLWLVLSSLKTGAELFSSPRETTHALSDSSREPERFPVFQNGICIGDDVDPPRDRPGIRRVAVPPIAELECHRGLTPGVDSLVMEG